MIPQRHTALFEAANGPSSSSSYHDIANQSYSLPFGRSGMNGLCYTPRWPTVDLSSAGRSICSASSQWVISVLACETRSRARGGARRSSDEPLR